MKIFSRNGIILIAIIIICVCAVAFLSLNAIPNAKSITIEAQGSNVPLDSKLVYFTLKNKSFMRISYGTPFCIDQMIDEEWIEVVPYDRVNFELGAYDLLAFSSVSIAYPISSYSPVLEVGEYRLRMDVRYDSTVLELSCRFYFC